MKKILILIVVILPLISWAQTEIVYPGDELPQDSALLFAPDLINTGLFTRDFSMTPDGKEIYFSIMTGRSAVIMVSKFENGKWQEPEIAPFSGNKGFFDFEPHVSPDGNKIYYLTTRPTKGEEEKAGWQNQNIFFVEKTEKGWSEPNDIGSPVNTVNNEFFPSLTNNKIYYNHSVEFNDVAMYCSKIEGGKYSEPKKLTFKNDSNLLLYNATVSRDESFILTCGAVKGSRKPARYYVAFNLSNNNWSDLYDLTDYLGYEGGRAASISLSPDGKYIFFSAIVANKKLADVYPGMKISEILDNNMKPQSGSSNVYWIRSDFINDIKNKVFNE